MTDTGESRPYQPHPAPVAMSQVARQDVLTRPRLLDLFSGAGGAAMGYHRAGFEVVGVDIEPQRHYPFEFHQGDALEVLLTGCIGGYTLADFTAIHASPPCQDHSRAKAATGRVHGTGWMLGETRRRLEHPANLTWVIENVPGAPMRADYKLCGCMFGLPGLRRERWFETSWHAFDLRSPCHHTGETVTVAGHSAQGRQYKEGIKHGQADRIIAMGIDWMNRDELAQAIPPAYTEHIGAQLIVNLTVTDRGVAS